MLQIALWSTTANVISRNHELTQNATKLSKILQVFKFEQ